MISGGGPIALGVVVVGEGAVVVTLTPPFVVGDNCAGELAGLLPFVVPVVFIGFGSCFPPFPAGGCLVVVG